MIILKSKKHNKFRKELKMKLINDTTRIVLKLFTPQRQKPNPKHAIIKELSKGNSPGKVNFHVCDRA